MSEVKGVLRLSGGQRVALAGACLLGLGLAAYGAAGSYETVVRLAATAGVPLPRWVPVGIDGGLIGVVVLDLALAWTEQPVGWLRQLARLLTVGTVAANVSAGWPDPISVGLHAAAPVMLLAMVEAGRAVLLRRAGLAAGMVRDRVPLARWVLSPWRTWLLWRRMVMWQVSSYRTALDTEARLRRARTLLRGEFGRGWRRKAPADLVWMLGVAPFVEEACARADTMTGHQDGVGHAAALTDGVQVCLSNRPRIGAEATGSAFGEAREGSDQLEEAMRLNERHWAERSRPVSAETLRKHLRVGAVRARTLATAVRAMDRAAVEQRVALIE